MKEYEGEVVFGVGPSDFISMDVVTILFKTLKKADEFVVGLGYMRMEGDDLEEGLKYQLPEIDREKYPEYPDPKTDLEKSDDPVWVNPKTVEKALAKDGRYYSTGGGFPPREIHIKAIEFGVPFTVVSDD